jgi:hypothetical protein
MQAVSETGRLRRKPDPVSVGRPAAGVTGPPNGLARRLRPVSASLSLPRVFGFGVADRLPLQVDDGIESATGERHNVIFPITGAGTACQPRLRRVTQTDRPDSLKTTGPLARGPATRSPREISRRSPATTNRHGSQNRILMINKGRFIVR